MRSTTLLTLDDALIERSAGAIVVTANDRLHTALIDAFVAHGPDHAPTILQLDHYLRARFAELSTRHEVGLLLTPLAQRLAWIERAPPLRDVDPEHLYREIASAWSTIHDWGLLDHLARFEDNESQRLFRDWAQRYNSVAEARNWVTEPELARIVADAVRRRTIHADSLVFVGFDVVSTSVQQLIDATRFSGGRADLHRVPMARARDVAFWTYDDSDRELGAAIRWAREVLDSDDATQTVCIVVPDASVDHDALVERLDAWLRPADAYPAASDSRYNVSGSITLVDVPVVADALRLLKWMSESLHYRDVERLLRSPFFSFGVDPNYAHATELPESYPAGRLTRSQASSPLSDIVGFVRRIGLLRLDAATQSIREILRRVGWPNAARLTAESREAVVVFESLLEDLADCAPFVEAGDLATMAAHVELAAARRSYAPARPAARLQILGSLETVGLDFAHMWVTGLDDARWPAPPRPNPFVPLRLQRLAGVPRCDVDGELAFTRRMTERWLCGARNVVLSHARNRDDEPHHASRLVIDMIGEPVRPPVVPDPLGHPFLRKSTNAALETRTEPSVGPIRSERLRHRGSAILRDQSACPFRAFARHRLLVESPRTPHSFPDAADRGVAVHSALRTLFEPAGDDRALANALDSQDAVARAVAAGLTAVDRFPEAFRDSERARLCRLLDEWIDVERARRPFRTISTERATTLSLGGLEFSLQIDRVDRDDDDVLVLDYKTGDVSANSLFGERPEEPQLPMYALATSDSSVVAFAELRVGRCRLNGWAKRPQSVRTIRLRLPPEDGGDWQRMKATWRRRLIALTDEFATGVVDVDPRDAKACQECDLHALCRIREIERIAGD